MTTRPRFAFAILLMLTLLFGCQQEPFDGATDSGGESGNTVGSAEENSGGAPRAEILTASLEEPQDKTEPAPAQDSKSETKPASEPKEGSKKKHTNRLARETSPYLLMHKNNPVNWYPWGPEAFEKAKKEDKVIFLSIGYSSCYWCHVMERLVFENEKIAKYMNENFVNIKVDREERPDVDDIYMTLAAGLLQPGRFAAGRRLAAIDVPHTRRQTDRRRHLLSSRGQRRSRELPGN